MWNADDYARTLDFVAWAHQGQHVTGSELPYLVHVVKVSSEVLHAFNARPDFDVNLAATCALLHDTLEDTKVTKAELVERFGQHVADGVEALSKDARLPKEQRLADSLRRLGAQPKAVQLVKLADRITNLEPPPTSWNHDKRASYREQAKLILDALGAAHPALAVRLERRIQRYQQYL